MRIALYLCMIGFLASSAMAEWRSLDASAVSTLQDDDLERHRGDGSFLDGIEVSDIRFSENGFEWHLIRFKNAANPSGPLWVAPHDDENVAFESMIAALNRHGGVGISINTVPASTRRQAGLGRCGVRTETVSACDPNRNFDARTPLFTRAILDQLPVNQPVIALHSNGAGFSGDGKGGRGGITMLDAAAYARGRVSVRSDGYFGNASVAVLDDPDVYAIVPYASAQGIGPVHVKCRTALNDAGANVWHERVGKSDGSLSNYLALNRPEIAYINFEAKREADLKPGTEAQRLMIDAYLNGCSPLWNQPTASPATGR